MGISKVEFGGKTLVDLTEDTVAPNAMMRGCVAHGADGERAIGTFVPTADHDLILARGKTTRVTVNLALSDGTPYSLRDGETLSMFLWHAAYDISVEADGCVFDITVPVDADVPTEEDYNYLHYDVYLHSGGNMYLAAYCEADVVDGDAFPQVIDGLVDRETRVCTSVNEWKRSDYALVDETATAIPSSCAGRYCKARSIRLPNITETVLFNNYGAMFNATELRHVDLRSCAKITAPDLYDAFTMDSLELPELTTVGEYFMYENGARALEMPKLTSAGSNAFCLLPNLKKLSLPSLTAVNSSYTSLSCLSCAKVDLPKLTAVPKWGLLQTNARSITLPSCTTINANAFLYSTNLLQFVLPGSTMCTLSSSLYYQTTPTVLRIYVNDDLVESYKSATNWSAYANYIKPISEWDGSNPPVNEEESGWDD